MDTTPTHTNEKAENIQKAETTETTETSETKETPENVQNVIREMEKEGKSKVAQLLNSNIKDSNIMLENISNIMKEGEKNFIQKTGRRMTYSEIRQAYG